VKARRRRQAIARVCLWFDRADGRWCWRVWYPGGGAIGGYGFRTRARACRDLRPYLEG
jgi:hypothetical protein